MAVTGGSPVVHRCEDQRLDLEEASLNLLEAEADALDAIDTAPRPEVLGEENADPLEAGGRYGGRYGGRGNPEDL